MEPFIPAIFALLGALIPTVASIVMQLLQPRVKAKEELLRIQRDVMDAWLESIQDVINAVHASDAERKNSIENFMRAVNKAALYVDSETAEKLIAYRDKTFEGGIEKADHEIFQNEIINSMRTNNGLKRVEKFKVIGNHLPGN